MTPGPARLEVRMLPQLLPEPRRDLLKRQDVQRPQLLVKEADESVAAYVLYPFAEDLRSVVAPSLIPQRLPLGEVCGAQGSAPENRLGRFLPPPHEARKITSMLVFFSKLVVGLRKTSSNNLVRPPPIVSRTSTSTSTSSSDIHLTALVLSPNFFRSSSPDSCSPTTSKPTSTCLTTGPVDLFSMVENGLSCYGQHDFVVKALARTVWSYCELLTTNNRLDHFDVPWLAAVLNDVPRMASYLRSIELCGSNA